MRKKFKCINGNCNNKVHKKGFKCVSCSRKGRIITKEWRLKISKAMKKLKIKPPSQKGKHYSEIHKKRIKVGLIKYWAEHPEQAKERMAHLKGIPISEEVRKKISLSKTGKVQHHQSNCQCAACKSKRGEYDGKNNPNFKHGQGYAPYSSFFNKQLKERVRVRDNFVCQLCGVPELEFYERLSIHHIDYDKNNCGLNNLITLCRNCNCKVNGNRKYWKVYFEKKRRGLNASLY
jgi:hypothetical protein